MVSEAGEEYLGASSTNTQSVVVDMGCKTQQWRKIESATPCPILFQTQRKMHLEDKRDDITLQSSGTCLCFQSSNHCDELNFSNFAVRRQVRKLLCLSCACPPALGWWIKTVIVTAENSGFFWSSANLFLASVRNSGKPECRPGKGSLGIIKYILSWYSHIDKPPVA